MTLREVTHTVIKRVEDASGCPVVVSVFTRYATIDRHVDALYGLTREEIAIIEESRLEKAGSAEGGEDTAVEENQ